jgi:hypothetical protein
VNNKTRIQQIEEAKNFSYDTFFHLLLLDNEGNEIWTLSENFSSFEENESESVFEENETFFLSLLMSKK